jgi:hypothetical protein
MNNGTYGYPVAPNVAKRVAPSKWCNYKLITATTSAEVVPQNVYQMLVMVWGGGADGDFSNGGAGGGFAMGVVDVTPGQLLPTITVGAIGGTSSFGTLLTATGGSGRTTVGTGSFTGVRSGFSANGGQGATGGGGGGSGSPYGNGGSGGYQGGADVARPLASGTYADARQSGSEWFDVVLSANGAWAPRGWTVSPTNYPPDGGRLRVLGAYVTSGAPDPDPETWEPQEITPAQDDIVAAIYGEHPDLGQSVISQGTLHLPDSLRIGLLAVWAGVESGISA